MQIKQLGTIKIILVTIKKLWSNFLDFMFQVSLKTI